MRTLLVAAAVILSVTAAQAQQMVPAKPAADVAQTSTDRAVPPVASRTIIEQLKAAGELKDTKTLEAPAPKLDSVDAKPAEAKPAEAPVAAAAPVEAKPVETKAVETKPVEAKPVQAVTEAKPVKKRVVKRETDEQKARRIAAKYGVSW